MWLDQDGRTWTFPSLIVRALCAPGSLTPSETYFVLTSLGVEERFREWWDSSRFFAEAGLANAAISTLRREANARIQPLVGGDHKPAPGCSYCKHVPGTVCCAYHEWLSREGEILWAAGLVEDARQHFQRCIDEGAARPFVFAAGLGGLVRLHFVLGEYERCIELFRSACPPHAYFVEKQELSGRLKNTPLPEWLSESEAIMKRYPGKSASFVRVTQYMSKAIIAAAVCSGGVDSALKSMLVDYFKLSGTDVDDLAMAMADEAVIPPLRKRVAPKPIATDRGLKELLADGNTERARRICERVPHAASFVDASARLIDRYIESGNEGDLDDLLRAASPFGVGSADDLVLQQALRLRDTKIRSVPSRYLRFIRRLSLVTRYPCNDFLDDFSAALLRSQETVEAGDIVTAILRVDWYRTRFQVDDTSRSGQAGGLGKTEIGENREWMEVALRGFVPALDRSTFLDRESAIEALYRAYQYLRERFLNAKKEDAWISESMLGVALSQLFGTDDVQRHARPIWLSPQHLDYFIPVRSLAVEYMGAQHYRPVSVFGGVKTFGETTERDGRKRRACERMGIALEYVTHEQDIGRRAKEIFEKYAKAGGAEHS